MMGKPLMAKAYGSIGHLPTSKLGPGDHRINDGQARILTEKVRDKHDRIIVEQKIDGSCVAVCKLDDGSLVSIGRAGHTADSSPHEQHRMFARWARESHDRFDAALLCGERMVGEWIAQAHGIKYAPPHEFFVAFDVMSGKDRLGREEFWNRAGRGSFVTPQLVHDGNAIAVDAAMGLVSQAFHGAECQPEGLVYRVERKGVVDFLAKHVRSDFVPGRYLPEIGKCEPVWNVLANTHRSEE